MKPLLSTEVTFGLRAGESLEDAQRWIGGALGVPLTWGDDLALGGAILEYQPRPLPDAGVASIRVTANQLDCLWLAPHRKELPLVAQIWRRGGNLLEAGRLADEMLARAADRAVLTRYVVAPGLPGRGGDLWRAHGAIFTTDGAGARVWGPTASPVGDDIRWSEEWPAPVLTGHVTFAVRAPDWEGALAAARAAFPVAYAEGNDEEIGGAYFEHVGADGSRLLLRHNAVNRFTWLFEERKDVAFLLDVTMRTQSLLDLGRVAAAIAAKGDLAAIAWRAVGDIVHDRVPRILAG